MMPEGAEEARGNQKAALAGVVHEAKVEEARALESGDKLASTRAQARRKYGW